MPQFRYEGFAHLLYRDAEDTKPVRKGEVASFSNAFVDRLTKEGHRFTPVQDLSQNEVEEAKNVELNPALVSNDAIVDETRKPKGK